MPRPFICHTCGSDLEVSPKCDCDKELTMTDKMRSTRHQMRQDMFNSMRELIGSGYIKEHYINCMADFVDIAEGYAEQKHAEEIDSIGVAAVRGLNKLKAEHADEIAALRAEHRAAMAGLCDEIERLETHTSEDGNLIYLVHIDDVLAVIKQRISDE